MTNNEFVEFKCEVGMRFQETMLDKHKDFIIGLAKNLFRNKKYIITKSNGTITIKGWIKN
ncbi:hypothetical protein [Solidesulfovibrio sp.]